MHQVRVRVGSGLGLITFEGRVAIMVRTILGVFTVKSNAKVREGTGEMLCCGERRRSRWPS